ncbi:MAG: NgoFVII family restriction endonuclease [Chitinophagales bacterium]|nr:NgoFVII family restriction endonuclease [Chitinophagaceae bacterium]MCB9065313.1 NgoFVII family restriction endonuclease [Chitinophagales bacterium]
MITLLKNPIETTFFDLVKSCNSSIKIACPFVKEHIISAIIKQKQASTTIQLITSFKLMNYYLNVSDLSALSLILRNNGIVKNHQRLHCKIYIFDDQKAIISSGNLTSGGIKNNYEYGLLIDDKTMAGAILCDYNTLSNHELTSQILQKDITTAERIISRVPRNEPITLAEPILEHSEEIDIFTGGLSSIRDTLSGWSLDVFDCLIRIQANTFTLTHVHETFTDELKRKYPNNNTIDASIRHNLQRLRDIGLIEFVDNRGNYRKLWE